MLCIDNWGLLEISSKNYQHCLVGIDHFSKAATAMPVVAINAEIGIHFIEMAKAM
jgi:hypothetical protein